MRKIIFFIMFFFIFATCAVSQEYIEAEDICSNGTWSIVDQFTAIRAEDKLSVAIPNDVVIFDCDERKINYYNKLNGLGAELRCIKHQNNNGEWHVYQIQIRCE